MSQSKFENMTIDDIIAVCNISKKTIEYHYEIETEALKNDDIYNGSMVEYVADELAYIDEDAGEYEYYETIAKQIMDKIGDDIAKEICDRDNDAIESENERREAMKGNY